jgi:CRP/FNR family transcriptional regulator, cyclic AMP receptor protein
MNKLFPQQSDHPLFRYFTDSERAGVEGLGRVVRIAKDGYLIRESELDSTLFAVEDGRLEIVGLRNGRPSVLATVGPGDVLGEVSFIDDSPRSVSVKAGEDTAVRAWEKKTLTEALAFNPELLAKFSVAMNELLVERLRDTVRRQGSFRPV